MLSRTLAKIVVFSLLFVLLLAMSSFGQVYNATLLLKTETEKAFNEYYSVTVNGERVTRRMADNFFFTLHPSGEGKYVILHEIRLFDSQYKKIKYLSDIRGFWGRATLSWRNSDMEFGETEFTFIWDREAGKIVKLKVLCTNGVLREQAMGVLENNNGVLRDR